jgi:hypothetical protein
MFHTMICAFGFVSCCVNHSRSRRQPKGMERRHSKTGYYTLIREGRDSGCASSGTDVPGWETSRPTVLADGKVRDGLGFGIMVLELVGGDGNGADD